ncbi:type II toxin-antitoxin system death-on-curing family toxin [Thiorhodococcus minor]|uniref:Type II toxin-antitoxin system death-on-curing family toxin n=1 Tax=Thiorhodococcus minor TaxID=57489 RepID=A0A6M0K7X4_9GAMM|nr:type II toxin-antitoxin system death-on-curing family toxin [Thiorhodococcus minor]NEV64767.1 type II toxin-antitoxin system death-on-curing family toxin [Thiorhodococcus minor]
MDERAVLLIHQRQLAEHGGHSGVRDPGILESAPAAPQQMFSYGSPDLWELGACYGSRLAGNHPFVDGNKRTAWVYSRLFLRLNGLDIAADVAEKVDIMLGVASGAISQSAFAQWLRDQARA